VAITGTAAAGQVLTATASGFMLGAPAGSYIYTWYRCTNSADTPGSGTCTTIDQSSTATSSTTDTYTVVGGDSNYHLKVVAIASNSCATGCGSASASATAAPTSLWIGDSYTFGAGVSEPWIYGVGRMTPTLLGWNYWLDAEGGTGFIASGVPGYGFQPIPDRLPNWAGYTPDYVVLDGGRNDWNASWDVLNPVVVNYLQALSQTFPQAKIIIIAPYAMNSGVGGYDYLQLRCLLDSQAISYGWRYVDPSSLGWIDAYAATLVGSDDYHPSEAGYTYLADHLAPAILDAESGPLQTMPAACAGVTF
jgi:hypothetical protein